MGKRVVFVWLDVRAKNEKSDLTAADKRELRATCQCWRICNMAQAKRAPAKHSPAGKRLIGSMREVQALEFARRARSVREGLGLSQAEFARRFGLSLRSLQEWEQARRLPDRAVFPYLRVIE